MDSVRKRLIQVVQEKGLDLKTLSLKLERNQAYLHQFIHKGTPKFLNEVDRKQLAAWLNISERELGAPFSRDTEPKPLKLISSYDPDETDAESNGYSREHWVPSIEGAIPELDVKLGAGEGTVGEIINLPVGEERISGHRVVAEWLVPENYLTHEAKASGQNTIVMEVIGDSMQPSYMPGDRVLVDLLQNKMVADTVYAISDGVGEPQIKRLQRIPFSTPVKVNIISDNPVLQMFTVELDQLQIIGRVCGHIARR